MKKFFVFSLNAISATAVILLFFTSYSLAAIVHVPSDYPTIQSAIDSVNNGDVVIVGQGTYREHINFLGKGITVKSIDPNDSHIIASTIIDGNQEYRGVTFNSGEGSDSVLNGITIQNGDIRNYEYEDPNYECGGGILCSNSSPTITHCLISGNAANEGGGIFCKSSSPVIDSCIIINNTVAFEDGGGGCGGGIACDEESSPIICNCTISENMAGAGGGIDNHSPSLTITDCLISKNSALCGGGINCEYQSALTIERCVISENEASRGGGGIKAESHSALVVIDCTINENTAKREGGGLSLWCVGQEPTIVNCTISANKAGLEGGGIFCHVDSPNITNCTITRNSAERGGGMFYQGLWGMPWIEYVSPIPAVDACEPKIIHCTIAENIASLSGGGIFCYLSSPDITNCILWEDYPNEISVSNFEKIPSFRKSRGMFFSPKITYSDVQMKFPRRRIASYNLRMRGRFWRYPGRGNMNADPLFMDPEAGDYRLQADSPCIDAGVELNLLETQKCKDGVVRPQDGDNGGLAGYDMGAYEYYQGL